MDQKAMQCFLSKCKKAMIMVENDMPIGIFHDFLMEIKGLMVERMVKAHKEQEAEMGEKKDEDSSKEEMPKED